MMNDMNNIGSPGLRGPAGVCLVVATCMKNAGVLAAAWAKSALAVADKAVVVDTGSTDNTIAILQQHGVEVHVSKHFNQTTKREDFAFDVARNEVSDLIPQGYWILDLDADEALIADGDWLKELEEVPPHINMLSCEVRMKTAAGQLMTTFQGERLYRNLPEVRWQNAMHNCLNVPEQQRGRCVSLSVDSFRGVDTPENDAERSKQRVAMAEKYFGKRVTEDPQDSRSMFYLGQTYHDVRDYTKAVPWFERYLTVSVFRDEAYQAGMYLAQCLIGLNDLDKAEQAMSACLRFNPTRAEGFALLGRIAYTQKRLEESVTWFQIATQCKHPVTRFFREAAVYGYDTWDRLSMALHNLGRNKEALAAGVMALEDPQIPWETRDRITKNLGYFDVGGGAYYDNHWAAKPWPTPNEAKRTERMVELLGTPESILDVGCGPGWPMAYKDAATQYTGVDWSAQARRLVEERGGTTHEHLESVPDKQYDACLLGEILEHVHDDTMFLKEVSRKLTPGATLVVSVPLFGVMQDPAHVRDYQKEQLTALLLTVCDTVDVSEQIWPWQIMAGTTHKIDSHANDQAASPAEPQTDGG